MLWLISDQVIGEKLETRFFEGQMLIILFHDHSDCFVTRFQVPTPRSGTTIYPELSFRHTII